MDYEALGRYTAGLEALRRLESERDRLIVKLMDGLRRIFGKDTGISRFYLIEILSMRELINGIESLNYEIGKVATEVNYFADKCEKPKINLEVVEWKD
ncbi:hypothetical protein [Thermodesulfovibrio yellowstonii]|uniref:hypothetical protein n=1 Tax=Thermodesulfovibrio yellowstonii TaxID=28262 RepID=UPI0024B32791|nr:hypothetical protein [Thermodesulfovibrio yellowstonii]MDI6865769.1 hypothetical protein [Thermodesulfovibrio yellowstonii]